MLHQKMFNRNSITLQDGRKLTYYELGDPNGKPVFNCHGGLVNGLDIAYAHAAAKKAGIRIISPNRPGIDGSSFVKNRKLLDWPSDIVELADYLDIREFAVIGWSMGGQYALACAFTLPNRVSKVIMIAGCIELDKRKNFAELNPLDKRFSRMGHKHPFFARKVYKSMWLMARFMPILWRKLSIKSLSVADNKVILNEPVNNFSLPMAKALKYTKAMIEEYNVFIAPWRFELIQVQVPVEIWQGTADTLVPSVWAEKTHSCLPHSNLHLLEGQGHFLGHSKVDIILASI